MNSITCKKCQLVLAESEFYSAKKRGKIIRYTECKTCFRQRMNERHEAVKQLLVAEHGGKCTRCGYDKSSRILHFHHLDSSKKEFGLGQRASASLERLRIEAAKCVLLCPNCHAEKHEGMW